MTHLDDVAARDMALPTELLETVRSYIKDLASTTLDLEEERLTVYVEAWFVPFDMANVGFTILFDGRVLDDEKQTAVLEALQVDIHNF